MSIWDVELDRLRASRLLALRMHVARYIVREGAAQRSVVALLDSATLARSGGVMLELLEASGARDPRVAALPVLRGAPPAPPPMAELVLHGRAGVSAPALAQELQGTDYGSGAQVWVFDVARVLHDVQSHVAESVETLIRIVTPEALGANGTPPPAEVAIRVA